MKPKIVTLILLGLFLFNLSFFGIVRQRQIDWTTHIENLQRNVSEFLEANVMADMNSKDN